MQPRHVPRLQGCLRDHLAAQLPRPQATDTLRAAKQKTGTGLRLVVRAAWGPETSPAGQGHNRRGAFSSSPAGGQGHLMLQSTSPRLQNLQLGWRQKPYHKSERRGCFSQGTDSKAGPQKHQEPGNVAPPGRQRKRAWLRPGRQKQSGTQNPSSAQAAEKLQEHGKSASSLSVENNCPEAAQ